MENVMLCEFCDVVVLWCRVITLGIFQQYSNSYIHLLFSFSTFVCKVISIQGLWRLQLIYYDSHCKLLVVQKVRVEYTNQQIRHHCVALYMEKEHEMLALEAHFDMKCPNVPTFDNRPSSQCKFCKSMFKNKNTLSYHIMMNFCLKYTRKELLKMYPTITKYEVKELTKLREKHGKTLSNRLNHPIDGTT